MTAIQETPDAHPALPEQFAIGSYGDPVWYMRAPHGALMGLHWNRIKLANETPLTDPAHFELLESAKHLLILYCTSPAARRRGKPPRAQTVRDFFNCLRVFLIWMDQRRLSRFSDVTISEAAVYRTHLEGLTVSTRRGGIKEHRALKKPLAPNTLFNRIQPIVYLTRLQSEMPTDGARLNRYEVDDLFAKIVANASKTDRKTDRIPDAFFQRLIDGATDFISRGTAEQIASYMAKFEMAWESHRPTIIVAFRSNGRERNDDKSRLFDKWRKANGDRATLYTVYARNAEPICDFGLRQLAQEIALLRGACLAIIASLVGMRSSELNTLKVGCLRVRRLNDGRSLLYIHGTLYKTSDLSHGEPADWVAGWDERDNRVRAAIETLELLAKAEDSDFLFPEHQSERESSVANERVAQGRPSSRAATPESLIRYVRRFAKSIGIGETEWHFHLHQFRKTFARFVALSSMRAAYALMRHYKHISILMTERYFPEDPDLISDICEASEQLIAQRLDAVLAADKLGGIKGEQILASNLPYRGPEHAEERRRIVTMTLEDPTFRVLMHVYGLCIYERDTAKCNGELANVGFDTCSTCPNAVFDQTNVEHLTSRLDSIEEAYTMRKAGGYIDIDLIRQRDQVTGILASLINGT